MANANTPRKSCPTHIDGALGVWELRSAKLAPVPAMITLSADGLRSATLTNQIIAVRHTLDDSLISTVTLPAAPVSDLSLSADGAFLLSVWATRDKSGGARREAQLWEVSTAEPRGPRIPCDAGRTNLTLAPAGRRLAAFGGTNVVVSDTATGERLFTLGATPRGISRLENVVFDRSGQRLALFCASSRFVELWDISAREPRLVTAISNAIHVSHVEFAPNDRLFLIATSDSDLKPGLAQVCDAQTGRPVGLPLPHADGVRHAAFSPDGARVLTCAEDFTAALWDTRTGARLPIEPMLHKEYVRHGAFSRDGRWLVTPEKNGAVRLWDAATGSLLAPPLSHPSWIYSAEFLAGAGRLATRSRDGQVFLWDLPEDPRPLPELRLIAKVVSGQRSVDARPSHTQVPDELRRNWRHLRTLYPSDFSVER